MLKTPTWPWAVAVGLAPIIVAIAVDPVLDGGINDDWAFIHMAQLFVQTGHVVYSGWIMPLSVPAVALGGLLIRLFGFSYLTLRLSILPFWAGIGIPIWMLGRRIGLSPSNTLCAAVSPQDMSSTETPSLPNKGN